ncbi:hypothetical protein RchiOBHm_Chr1g0328021 [Rosa chinensis]|uniref:Uncharacterized protein n=1 Tax=Rosa chinensis TaxID=74649 RepID=A0A2P6SAM2_ROSCH|nr:hypothetical protein RchiOBHm_Chr1g0328021 [Rosa chinensis]
MAIPPFLPLYITKISESWFLREASVNAVFIVSQHQTQPSKSTAVKAWKHWNIWHLLI